MSGSRSSTQPRKPKGFLLTQERETERLRMTWVTRNQQCQGGLKSSEKRAGNHESEFLGKNTRSKSELDQVHDSIHALLGITHGHERQGRGTGTCRKQQKSRAERLSKPMRQRCKSGQSGHPETSLDWTMYHASQTPGPGAYNTSVRKSGEGNGNELHLIGKFNNTKLRTLTEEEVHLKRGIPGPQDYSLPVCFPNVAEGRKISEFKPKTELEWELHRAKGIPGANQYNTEPTWKSTGAVIGGGKRSDQWSGNDNPGPGEHGDIPNILKGLKGGKIPEAIVKNDVEWKEHFAREIPGPAQYSIAKDQRITLPKGGKLGPPSKAKSELEVYINTFADNPGPGEYASNSSSLSTKGGYLLRSGTQHYSVSR